MAIEKKPRPKRTRKPAAKKETRAQRSARLSAEHQARHAAREAAKEGVDAPEESDPAHVPGGTRAGTGEAKGSPDANSSPAGDPEKPENDADSEETPKNALVTMRSTDDPTGLVADGHFEMPRYEPNKEDRHTVAALRASGFMPEAVARYLGLPLETVEEHYRYQLDHGHEFILAEAALMVIRGALSPKGFIDRQFLLKSRGGWGGSKGLPMAPGVAAAEDALEPPGPSVAAGTKAFAPSSSFGIPPAGPNGKVPLTMNIGIAGDSMGADAEDEEDDDDD